MGSNASYQDDSQEGSPIENRRTSSVVNRRTANHMEQDVRSKTNQKVPTLTKKQRKVRSQLIAKNLNFSLPIKLDQNNFIYWKAQILPIIRAFDLEEFIFGPVKSSQKYIEFEDKETGEMVLNISDEFLNWKKIDQLLVGWILSTLRESISG
ncbi:hypothetical protein Ddye_022535 [Dipteronia dyeriana]|uniref:Uncharacterized protein n=1 Tax=Dipteronia dyeriana TaxID=168575 RepID=A0AAD9WSH0_9ROSI|nr:hypothetical protein Ddye_022535 [Dipteronia dyeriana]